MSTVSAQRLTGPTVVNNHRTTELSADQVIYYSTSKNRRTSGFCPVGLLEAFKIIFSNSVDVQCEQET